MNERDLGMASVILIAAVTFGMWQQDIFAGLFMSSFLLLLIAIFTKP